MLNDNDNEAVSGLSGNRSHNESLASIYQPGTDVAEVAVCPLPVTTVEMQLHQIGDKCSCAEAGAEAEAGAGAASAGGR